MLDGKKGLRVAGGCQRQTCSHRSAAACSKDEECMCPAKWHSLWKHEASVDQDIAIVHSNQHAVHANLSQAANWQHA